MKDESLSLAQLIDLEVAAAADRTESLEVLRERDAKIGRDLAAKAGRSLAELPMGRVLSNWAMQVVGSPSPGAKFVEFLTLSDLILLVLGLAIGGSAAAAILQYDGTTPVNAIQYLGVFVFLQSALLVLLLTQFLFGARLGVVQEALRSLAYYSARLLDKFSDNLTTLRRIRKVYSSPETWLILKVTQRFGAAFNFGALGVMLYWVGFSDLAFSWSTTLDVTAEGFHGLLQAVAWPWHWLGDSWTLTLEQVRGTQYVRLEGKYVPSIGTGVATELSVVGAWWRYLAAAHITYGLLPRLILWAFAGRQYRRSLADVKLTGLAWGTILSRLQGERQLGARSKGLPDPKTHRVESVHGPCQVIRWRDFPGEEQAVRDYLRAKLGAEVKDIHAVGGSAPDHDGSQLPTEATSWVVMTEDWESPGKALLDLVKRLRSGAGEVVVAPVVIADDQLQGPDDDRLAVWQRHVDQLADAQIGVLA